MSTAEDLDNFQFIRTTGNDAHAISTSYGVSFIFSCFLRLTQPFFFKNVPFTFQPQPVFIIDNVNIKDSSKGTSSISHMKTSFYFVLWIIIYPILGLFHNPFLNNNAFIVALLAVWGLSWLINKAMPETLAYERFNNVLPIYEDIYTGNIGNFYKRLNRDFIIETVTAIYFCVSTVAISFAVFKMGMDNWIALIIFALFAYGVVTRSVQLSRARHDLGVTPTKEECENIAHNIYALDYESYKACREISSVEDMLSPRPKHLKAFQIISIVFAIIAALLGIVYLIYGITVFFSGISVGLWAAGMMGFLYGSLAIYFGIRDFLSILPRLRWKEANSRK